MTVLETCLWHASDWIAWVDRSDDARPERQALVDRLLMLRLSRAPRDLTLIHKPGRTLLWRSAPEGLRRTEPGSVDEAGRQRPEVPAYPLEGEVRDPAGRYLPRRFVLDVGTATGHAVPVYRSPLGVRYGRAGGLYGRAVFSDGTPAAWAILELTVTPPLTGALPYVAQADGRGEFCLALDRLPALTRDAPLSSYPATLRVKASLTAARAWIEAQALVDPDALDTVEVDSLPDLRVVPGRVARLASAGSAQLELQPGP